LPSLVRNDAPPSERRPEASPRSDLSDAVELFDRKGTDRGAHYVDVGHNFETADPVPEEVV